MLAVNCGVGIEQVGEDPNRGNPVATKGKRKEAGDKVLSAQAYRPTVLSTSCSLRSRSCRWLDIRRLWQATSVWQLQRVQDRLGRVALFEIRVPCLRCQGSLRHCHGMWTRRGYDWTLRTLAHWGSCPDLSWVDNIRIIPNCLASLNHLRKKWIKINATLT